MNAFDQLLQLQQAGTADRVSRVAALFDAIYPILRPYNAKATSVTSEAQGLIVLLERTPGQPTVEKAVWQLLDQLHRHVTIPVILCEGAEGQMNPQSLAFPHGQSATAKVCNYQVESGRLSGAEAMGATAASAPIFWGIDSSHFHRENTAAAQRVQSHIGCLGSLRSLLGTLPGASPNWDRKRAIICSLASLQLLPTEVAEWGGYFPTFVSLLAEVNGELQSAGKPKLDENGGHASLLKAGYEFYCCVANRSLAMPQNALKRLSDSDFLWGVATIAGFHGDSFENFFLQNNWIVCRNQVTDLPPFRQLAARSTERLLPPFPDSAVSQMEPRLMEWAVSEATGPFADVIKDWTAKYSELLYAAYHRGEFHGTSYSVILMFERALRENDSSKLSTFLFDRKLVKALLKSDPLQANIVTYFEHALRSNSLDTTETQRLIDAYHGWLGVLFRAIDERLCGLPQMELRERVLAIVKMLQIATILDVKSDSQRLENQLNEILSKRLGDDHLAIALFLLLDSPNATEEWRFRSEQAIKIIERIQPDGTKFRDTFRQLEASLFPLANRLQSARRFDETRLILSRVAQLARTLGDPFKEAVYQNNTAFTFTLEERWQDGLEGFMRAAQLFKEVGNDIETFVAENNWAACLVELGDLERAEPILQRSIAPLAEKGDARERKAHVYLAKIIEARGEIQEAINHLRRAVEIGKLVNPMYLDVDKLHLARLVSISDNGHPS